MFALRHFMSPIGIILIESNGDTITKIKITDEDLPKEISPHNQVLQHCTKELAQYFEGSRTTFTFKYENSGTPFRQTVWQALEKIPYGSTISYKQLACNINNQKAVRAVGGANHNNNIWIVVPCHRVIGANGNLTGYGGGIWRKQWLISYEKTNLNNFL